MLEYLWWKYLCRCRCRCRQSNREAIPRDMSINFIQGGYGYYKKNDRPPPPSVKAKGVKECPNGWLARMNSDGGITFSKASMLGPLHSSGWISVGAGNRHFNRRKGGLNRYTD